MLTTISHLLAAAAAFVLGLCATALFRKWSGSQGTTVAQERVAVPRAGGVPKRGQTRLFEFTLPDGYQDSTGRIHRSGVMRLPTHKDERLAQADPRLLQDPAYIVVRLLSQVIEKIGDLTEIHPEMIENLSVADVCYLQAFYRVLAGEDSSVVAVTCPACGQHWTVDILEPSHDSPEPSIRDAHHAPN